MTMRAKHALSDNCLVNNSMLESLDDHGESSSLKQRIASVSKLSWRNCFAAFCPQQSARHARSERHW